MGSAIYSDTSNIVLKGTKFNHHYASKGGVFYLNQNNNLTISNVSIDDSKA